MDLYTDRHLLTTEAYGDAAKLEARQSIYRYQQPAIDLPGWALGRVAWHGDERVVDVGCGNGGYLRRLARWPVRQLLGLDLSRGMLAGLARDWNEPAPLPRLAVADVQALPLPTASVDVALAMHMLYHVPDMALAARELRRVVHPGGVLLAVTNGAGHLQEIGDLYLASVAAVAGSQPERQPGFSDRFSLENGATILQGAFARVERHEVSSVLIIPETAPLLRYIASTRAMREPALPAGASWDVVMAEVERRAERIIAEQGAFRARTRVGVFECV